ncbi:CRY2 [Bugula neritina]|uniref:CRY2 n=1 Tax=Bugula neritina TaxID=10212 RepID=A0A7J7K809_BUGNE|nr:CRY2 [Bugula neritina]
MSTPKNEIAIPHELLFESSDEEVSGDASTAVHWFRRCLRFHDNPALCEAIRSTDSFRCVYIIDPSNFSTNSSVESNKWRFLIESLQDLDHTLKRHNSRLYIIEGQPTYILPLLFKHWNVTVLSLEEDPSPYGARRDDAICSFVNKMAFMSSSDAPTLSIL